MNQQSIQLNDYLVVLQRRKVALFVPLILVFAISLALAVFLPPVYRSTATILIEQQEIPQDLVRSTVTSYAAERIQVISQRVMTTDKLTKVVRKLKLLDGEDNAKNLDFEYLKEMRKNLFIEMLSADIINQRTGRASKATIAFTLSFESEFADVAKKVANEMTALFLDENLRIRTEKARTTSKFLSEESTRLGEKINLLEAALADYKKRNVGKLPELSRMNFSLMERTEKQLEEIERSIASLKERKLLSQSQLANVEPYTGQSPEVKLKRLMANYLSVASVYTSAHPDLVRMRKEIEILKKQTGVDDSTLIIEELAIARKNLADAGERYSSNHPDIRRLQNRVNLLEDKMKTVDRNLIKTGFKPKPDNPAYINLQTQIDSIDINIKASTEQKRRLKLKLAEYEERITDSPRVEQEGLALNRDYENAVKQYQEIKQKQLRAEVSEQLEKENKGERFSVIEPARFPQTPEKPNRLGIFLLGTVLSFAAGFGSAAVKEMLDHTVRGTKNLVSIVGSHPLSVIPFKATAKNIRKKTVIKWSIIITIIILLFAGGLLSVISM